MNLSYFHEQLSLAVFEMFASTQNLKGRLRSSLLKHPFTAAAVEIAPEVARQQFSEVKTALAGRLRHGGSSENYPDAIDRMKRADVQRLFNNIFSLYQAVTKEYHWRMFQGYRVKRGKKRHVSASARAKMAKAQRARWAKVRAARKNA